MTGAAKAFVLAAAAGLAAAWLPARAEVSDAAGLSGEAIFKTQCGICHQQMGTGTVTLARRVGWRNSLLAERRDLDPGYIGYVVRHGIGSMPPQTRVDLTDAELSSLIAYLTRPLSERDPDPPTSMRGRHE